MRISASIGDRWPECARQNDLYNLSGRKSEPPALRWDCQRYVRALAFAAGDPVPSLTAYYRVTAFSHNVRMSERYPLALRQADQARTDFATIESDLQFLMGQLARLDG